MKVYVEPRWNDFAKHEPIEPVTQLNWRFLNENRTHQKIIKLEIFMKSWCYINISYFKRSSNSGHKYSFYTRALILTEKRMKKINLAQLIRSSRMEQHEIIKWWRESEKNMFCVNQSYSGIDTSRLRFSCLSFHEILELESSLSMSQTFIRKSTIILINKIIGNLKVEMFYIKLKSLVRIFDKVSLFYNL